MKKYVVISLCALLFSCSSFAAGRFHATISGKVEGLKDGDSVAIQICKYGINLISQFSKRLKVPVHGNRFDYNFDEEGNMEEIDVKISWRGSMPDFFTYEWLRVFKEDNINFTSVGREVKFEGPHPLFYQFQQQMADSSRFSRPYDYANPMLQFKQFDTMRINALRMLEKKKYSLTDIQYSYLRASYTVGPELYKLNYLMLALAATADKSRNESAVNAWKLYRQQYGTSKKYVQGAINIYSYYPVLQIEEYIMDSFSVKGSPIDYKKVLSFFLKQKMEKSIKEAFVINILVKAKKYNEFSSLLDMLSSFSFENKEFENVVSNLKDKFYAGSVVFDAGLSDTTGKVHSLAELKGKTILVDFWYTGCGNCVKIHPYLEQVFHRYKPEDFVLVSVCIDKDKTSWITSIKDGKYTVPGEINLFTQGMGLEHPFIKYYHVADYPTLFIIGKDGKFRLRPLDPRVDDGKQLVEILDKCVNEKL